VEFAIRKPDALPNYKVQFFGLWLVGFLCWYMVGRFADDLISWRRNSALPRKHWADLTFALIAFPSAILLAGPFTVDRVGPTSLAVWGVFWLVITTCVLVLRIVQVIKQRRTTAAL
jgi:predicted permease